MTVRWRLLLTLGGFTILLALPALYAVSQLRRVSDIAESLEAVHAADVLALGRTRAAMAELARQQTNYVASPSEQYRLGVRRELRAARNHLLMLRASGFTESVAPALARVDTLDEAAARLEELVESGRTQEATSYFVQVKPVLDSARVSLTAIGDALDARGQDVREQAQRVSASASRTTMLVVSIAVLLTVALGLWTTDALSRPLRRLSDATARVADGEFRAPEGLPYAREDEIGHLSRAFRTMTERLAELDQLKAEFVSLASHELKTPINVIGGYAELLDEGLYGDLDEKQREIIELIQEQTSALTRLVNQLLDLSRFEAGGLQVEPQPVEVRRLLEEVGGSFRALATKKQIDFAVEGDDSLPQTIVLDHDRIRHEVLGNILSNAFKFTAPGGEISVRAWSEGDQMRMEVRDTGVGIPEDQLAHIFEKYYQVGTDAKSQGSGLGLAIAKHVVEAHGGELTATSATGEGTAFHILLPNEGPGEGPHPVVPPRPEEERPG